MNNNERLKLTSIVTGCLAALLLLALAPVPLFAQSELATLSGTVTDPSQAVLAGVAITVTNENTAAAAKSVTNQSGLYVIPELRPGVYTVQAALPSFKQYKQSGVTLQVNQSARLDISLAVGDVSEQVQVRSEAPLLEADTSSRGAVIDRLKIVELPLNGRDYNQLALLSPGVLMATPRLLSVGFTGVFNINGNRATQNAFVLDGVDNVSYATSYRGMNIQIVQPSVEALEEFKVQTNAYSAEFGRSAGALVNAVIKSGTNQIHGSAYEFLRNRDLDSTNFFSNKSGAVKPARLRNQFGATFGGPIVKNKTFIFGDYAGLRDRVGTVLFSSVPQPAWIQGRFTLAISNPFDPGDTGQDFKQPATADCNDGSGHCWIIPKSAIDPVGQRWVNVAPLPNTGTPGQIDNNYVGVPVTRNRTDQFDIRVDHNQLHGFNLFGRYSFVDTNKFQPAPRPGLAEGSYNDTFGSALLRSQGVAVGATRVLTPTLVSETRFGYSRGDYVQLPPNSGDGCPDQLIGLTGITTDPFLCGGLPPMSLPGGNLRRLSRTTSVPQWQYPRSYDFRQSVSWLHGTHSMKFGGEYLRTTVSDLDIGNLMGNFSFSGRFAGENNQYQGGIADLLMGLPSSYSQDTKTPFNLYQYIASVFAQDDWKATHKLTVNLGLRYEFAPPPRDSNSYMANFDQATQAYVTAKSGSIFGEALVHPDWYNFSPRAGLAYSILPHTVLRGAYGIFFNHSNRQGREAMLGFNPPFELQASAQVPGSGVLTAANAPFRLQDGVPAGFDTAAGVNMATVSRKAQDMNEKNPYVEQFNVTLQQQLGEHLMMELAYAGNLGHRMPAFRELNPFMYGFNSLGAPVVGARELASVGINGAIEYMAYTGISNYNSLQARVDRRFAAGFTALVSYTYGKALTDSPDHLSTSGTGNGVDVGEYRQPQGYGLSRRVTEYGPAEFDVKQRLVASGVWQIPFGEGRAHDLRRNRALDLALGGWEFSPILTVQSGLALTVGQGCSTSLGSEMVCRPNRLASGVLPDSQRTIDNWIDVTAFQAIQNDPTKAGFTPFQVFGNSGIGILRGPGLVNFDFNLNKTFAITERQGVQLRAEFFNAMNHANFSVPGVLLGAGFGQVVSTSTEARIIQFALKYRF